MLHQAPEGPEAAAAEVLSVFAAAAEVPSVRTASGALVAVPGRRSGELRNGWQRLGMQALQVS